MVMAVVLVIVLMMLVLVVEMWVWASSGGSAGPLLLILLADISNVAEERLVTLPPVLFV